MSTVASWGAAWVSWIVAFTEAPAVNTALDALILLIAAAPALYISFRFLFSDPIIARTLLLSPAVKNWFFFFCGLEIVFHIIKVPVLFKILAVVIATLLLPILALMELSH